MAKKISTQVDVNSFSSINDFLSQFDEDGALAEDYTELDPSEWIHSGSYLFNAQISGSILRGVPNNKIVAIPGDPKTGKTYLMMNMIKNFQKAGYFVYVWETENAWSKERMIKQGIDTKALRIMQPRTVSDVIISAVKQLDALMALRKAKKPLPNIVWVLDSQSGLNNKKEYEDALDGDTKTDMGTTAKDLKKLYNMTTVDCGKLGIAFLTTSHVRDEQIGKFISKKMSGGQAALYLASVLTCLTKTMDYDETTKERKGVKVKSHLMESRFSRHKNIEMYIPFDKPMNEFLGLEQFISWDTCGIARGKFVELIDFGYEFIQKKLVTKEDIIGFEFTSDYLLKNIAKTKQEALVGSISWFIENGYMEANGDIFKFTEKIYLNFRFPEIFDKLRNILDIVPLPLIEGVEENISGLDSEYFLQLMKAGYVTKNGNIIKGTKKLLSELENPQYQKMVDSVECLNPNSPTYAVKHLKKAIVPQLLYTKEVFTREVLEKIDEIVKPIFQYGEVQLESNTLNAEFVESNSEFGEFLNELS